MNRRTWVLVLSTLAVALSFSVMAAAEPVPEIELLTTTEAYDPIRYEAGFMIAEAWEKLGTE